LLATALGGLEKGIMMISGEVGGDDPLYLDDLQVGQRFTDAGRSTCAVNGTSGMTLAL
jgi:hypothetical protein